jgi:hypothetical protein
MNMLRSLRRSVLIVFAALVPVVIACDSATEPPPGLVGTWNATSLVVGGVDLMDDGMTLRFTFSANGEYSYTVANDFLDFCDPGPNCSDSGDFTATSSQITFDPGEDFEETFSYTVTGSTLSISAVIDGFNFAFTFEKQ